ncbi:MAG: NAD(P)/FAD-dependent oxidoreductase [Acutalibacteraceae bacterium]
MIRIADLSMPLGYTGSDLRRAAAKKLRLAPEQLKGLTLVRRSVDARRKSDVKFIVTVDVQAAGSEDKLLSRLRDGRIRQAPVRSYEMPRAGALSLRPVVVGFGPAGMFAGLLLARAGLRPIIVERGGAVEDRQAAVQRFWRTRALDGECNVQFGEGGAGTFSDGKLNTGTKDERIFFVLQTLAEHGAPEEILFDAKPHVGTDRLPQTVRAIREEIKILGGTVRFHTKMADLLVRDGAVQGVVLECGGARETLETRHVVLAVGHSARDTFNMLCAKACIPMEPKPFSVGARIEHRAEMIDRAQYGAFAGHPQLGAADYKLSVHLENGRGVYTFCMCPGGSVVGAASEAGGVVTNGMSEFARDGVNSNAALLVGVSPADFGGEGPLAGIAFQRAIERAAFEAGGGDYSAPCQRAGDFLERRRTAGFGDVRPTYLPGAVPGDLRAVLPDFVCDSMAQGIREMGKRLRGFDAPDALLTAPETRSSSPVRILRGENRECPAVRGLFPCGEGAGYAGGITSAAVDGLRCAEEILRQSAEKER